MGVRTINGLDYLDLTFTKEGCLSGLDAFNISLETETVKKVEFNGFIPVTGYCIEVYTESTIYHFKNLTSENYSKLLKTCPANCKKID